MTVFENVVSGLRQNHAACDPATRADQTKVMELLGLVRA
jgi:ABC-type sulfate/molybdate transport systems ATPase subunit